MANKLLKMAKRVFNLANRNKIIIAHYNRFKPVSILTQTGLKYFL
jgi:hypothetical protein